MPSGILGANGAPLPDPPSIHSKAAEEAVELMRNHRFGNLAHSMTMSWQLFQYVRGELEASGVSKEALDIIIRSMSVKAQQPFTLNGMVDAFEKHLMPFLHAESEHSKREDRKRKEQAIKVERSLPPEGFKLPSFEMAKKVGRFSLGSAFVVVGSDVAASVHALRNCGKWFKAQKFGVGYLGVMEKPKVSPPSYATVYMPPAWWGEMTVTRAKLEEAMSPLLKQNIQFLIVEDLCLAATLMKTDDPEARVMGLQRAFAMIRGWCMNNKLALIMGIDSAMIADHRDPAKSLPFLQSIPVVTATCLNVGVELKVVIGSDVLPLIEE